GGQRRIPRTVAHQNSSLPRKAEPVLVLDHDAPEPVAEHAGNLVVRGKPLVDERVVGRQQVEHARVITYTPVEQELRLTANRTRDGPIVMRVAGRVGRPRVESPKAEPLG